MDDGYTVYCAITWGDKDYSLERIGCLQYTCRIVTCDDKDYSLARNGWRLYICGTVTWGDKDFTYTVY